MKDPNQKRLIKRYRNRKLYDTTDSSYVTLEDIADYIRNGEDVCIIENATGEDITSISLAQIILEEEKRKKDALPLNILINLIRSSGATIREFVQKSIGEAKDLGQVKDDIYDNLERWVSRGSISHDEGNRFISSIKNFVESKVKPAVTNVQNLPSVQLDIQNLKKKLNHLEKELASYSKKRKTK